MGISWSSTRQTAPPVVPSDTVIPVHFWDNSCPGRSMVIFDLFRFDDVLDAGKLKTSLSKLLDRPGWRKLGARIRLNKNGNYDYHIPAYFDEERVPFAFHCEALDININEHPRASRFRRDPNADTPRIQCHEADWIDLMWQPGDPKGIGDYLYSDRPILGFRMITFVDATLLTISWPHMVFDTMGHAAFLRAWLLVLNGRDDEVPEFHGYESDPLGALGSQPVERYKYADKQFGTWHVIILGLRYAWDRLWDPKAEDGGRTIFVPAAYAQQLCETARSELKALQTKGEVSFISEGDIICAWWAQQLALALIPKPSNQEVGLYNVYGLRGRLGQDLLPSSRAYVGNAFCSAPAFMTVKDILTRPLGLIAAAVRQSYMDLSTRDQLEAAMSLARTAQDKGGAALFGSPWMHWITCSNWTKAGLFDMDFSGALTQRLGEGDHKAGKPTYIQIHAFQKSMLVSSFVVMGKDAEGNIWLYGHLKEKCWAAVNKILEDAVTR
ncbi:uncharacterized protein F4807DRAFT_449024 [Annulohypoxylon truncatum]|uniref:uncharacterized protein n=1 Tax=Annulohypoxylon truncatum TaxID=327061 RepID=UPI0020081A5F|nr:uncharacterized protein F4807DRAFT_449024 [Annulohypoxylon truncatum]KAI1204079.1 hypothetical protein F4807DRAFT_449024 [Annulohypoxylon truncatum]